MFPSAEGHLKMWIPYFFLLQMQIWNGCNALNIAGNSIKYINVNLSFLSSGSKVVKWTHGMVYKTFTLDHTMISVPDFMAVRCVLHVGLTPLGLEKKFKFISEVRIRSCGMDPLIWPLVEICSVLLLHVLSNDAWQICHKHCSHQLWAIWKCEFPNLFYCKCKFEMAIMHLILREAP